MEIKNFSIVAHIDHGKSTLADRFLELTGAVKKADLKEQFLDSMDLEREKGITIKMHPVRLVWQSGRHPDALFCHPEDTSPKDLIQQNDLLGRGDSSLSLRMTVPAGSGVILNLIDTPGHIDFNYEISRALACCEGALLLVDATKGVQAQTLFNLESAKKQNLTIIGCVNKVDAATRDQINSTKKELALILNTGEDEILEVSGKTGQNVEKLLTLIVEKFPSPKVPAGDVLKALVFDSKYDSFSGVVAFVRLFEGQVKRGDKILLMAQNQTAEVKEVGYFTPGLKPTEKLSAGEIGYIKTGIKEPGLVKVGETITLKVGTGSAPVPTLTFEPLPGYKEPQPVLFLSLYPESSDDFELLKDGLNKLKLSDPALDFQLESKMALGRGFRVGFLGSLHAEITIRRLKADFGLDLVATSPQVVFEVKLKNGETMSVSSPSFWPEPSLIDEAKEPFIEIEIVAPNEYYSAVYKTLQMFEAVLSETKTLTAQKSIFWARAPLREIVSGSFYEKLKSSTQGYASFSFKPSGMESANLVKVDILIASVQEEPFGRILPQHKAFEESKKLLQKLKEVLPHQQFSVSLQAAISGKIIARETITAMRKDVTAPLYGGDVTRKRKLLDKQKKGKQKLKGRGKVAIPAQTFLDVLRP